MKHQSAYLHWYTNVPSVRFDFRSSGIMHFKHDVTLGEVDLSSNYVHGNPETTRLLALRYSVKRESVFLSSEGASGQNARIIRCLAEKTGRKEAIVEYPTYEPLLRQVQEYFAHIKRLEREEGDSYKLDADQLRKIATDKTALLVITNPHAPSGAISQAGELKEIAEIAQEDGFYVLCDEVYAEFNRGRVPSIFSVDPELGVVTTSFTKAYGLGGLKLGIAITNAKLVEELYADVLNSVGNSPNIVQLAASKLLRDMQCLEAHKQKWTKLKEMTEEWLNETDLEYSPNISGVTYWIKLPIEDTYKWINDCAIPTYSLASVPGAFFLFKEGYGIEKSSRLRLGLGGIDPEVANLSQAFYTFERALQNRRPDG